jgi:CheY-like chemotaxis protein
MEQRLDTLRILLLEDSDLDAELVAEFVRRTGLSHTIERVITREAFLAAAQATCHDLILADYVLPAFDGLAALAIAREHCPGIPFVFVSGTLGEDVAVEALKGGATD